MCDNFCNFTYLHMEYLFLHYVKEGGWYVKVMRCDIMYFPNDLYIYK